MQMRVKYGVLTIMSILVGLGVPTGVWGLAECRDPRIWITTSNVVCYTGSNVGQYGYDCGRKWLGGKRCGPCNRPECRHYWQSNGAGPGWVDLRARIDGCNGRWDEDYKSVLVLRINITRSISRMIVEDFFASAIDWDGFKARGEPEGYPYLWSCPLGVFARPTSAETSFESKTVSADELSGLVTCTYNGVCKAQSHIVVTRPRGAFCRNPNYSNDSGPYSRDNAGDTIMAADVGIVYDTTDQFGFGLGQSYHVYQKHYYKESFTFSTPFPGIQARWDARRSLEVWGARDWQTVEDTIRFPLSPSDFQDWLGLFSGVSEGGEAFSIAQHSWRQGIRKDSDGSVKYVDLFAVNSLTATFFDVQTVLGVVTSFKIRFVYTVHTS